MRKVLAALFVLAAATVVAPPAAPAAAPPLGPPEPVGLRATTAVTGEGAERAARGTGLKARVIRLTNNRRENHGCNPVRARKALTKAAQKHSNKMRNRGRLSHRLPGEPGLKRRITREGYRPVAWGENIAFGYPTPQAVVQGWMSSSGHRANILNCQYKHIGIGIARNGAGHIYWTQVFAKPR